MRHRSTSEGWELASLELRAPDPLYKIDRTAHHDSDDGYFGGDFYRGDPGGRRTGGPKDLGRAC